MEAVMADGGISDSDGDVPTPKITQSGIKPYQFEPVKKVTMNVSYSSDESEEESEDEQAAEDTRMANLSWCSCNNCQIMPEEMECRCCCEFDLCSKKMEAAELSCITDHEGFIVNCLNTHVLEVAFYDYLDLKGPIGDEEPIHRLYRHIAYRRFARWIWHRLGKRNRKILPSCVVLKIRNTFPSISYTGFQYPRDY